MPSTAPPFISTVDNVDVPVAVKSVVVVPPLAVNAPVKVDAPVTPNVPATVVLPEEDSTVNLFVFTSKSPSIPVAPLTSKELLNVVAPVTPNVPPTVELPEALKVVNAPVDAEFAPIAVPSTAPPFISTVDNVDVPVAVKSVVVIPPLAVNAPVNVDAPVTPNVPATVVLPEEDSTVNLFVFTSKSPSIPVAPLTSKELLNVVAPETPNVPPTVELPDALKVVNAPVEAEFAPIAVPSIAPPLISTVDNVDVPVAVKSTVVLVPPTFKLLATPTPPSTFKAPVVVLVD